MAWPALALYVKLFISSGPHSHWEETTLFVVDAMSITLKAELAKIWEMSVRGADGTTRYLAVKDKLVPGKRPLQCLCCFSQASQR